MAGVLARFISSFLLAKYVALFHGPAGVALLGQYSGLSGILMNLSSGAIDNGIVRYVAEGRRDGTERLARVLSASAQIVIVLSLVTFGGAVVFAEKIALSVFYSNDYSGLVMLMGLMAFGHGALTWISNVLNGLGRLDSLALVNMISAFGIAVVVIIAIFRGGVGQYWLMAGVTCSTLPALAYAFWRFRRERRELPPWRLRRWPLADYTQFARYSVMSGAAALITPLCAIAVRDLLVRDSGLEAAGIYEGVNRLSTAYLSLITSTLAMYYLPRLSSAAEVDQRKEMRSMLVMVAPGLVVITGMVWFVRDPLLTLIYSKDFTVGGRLMVFQLAGDCFKMLSWVLAYQMIARGMVGTFVVAELAGNVLRLSAAWLLVPRWGVEGAVASYTITTLVYLVGMMFIFRDQFRSAR